MNTNAFSKTLTEDLLERVFKPGQYLGNEWGALHKSFDDARVRLSLTFPDTYELGMSNFGLKILYKIINGEDGFMADRAYAPMSDMEALLRERRLPLWALESRRPLCDFDLVGFSLQYELTYTNVLNILDLSGIPIEAQARTNLFPLVFGGGPSAVNPEPMARFMDFFIVGDGEHTLSAVMRVIERFKQTLKANGAAGHLEGNSRNGAGLQTIQLKRRLLLALAKSLPGVYVPSLYKVKEGMAENARAYAVPMENQELKDYLGASAGDIGLESIDLALGLSFHRKETAGDLIPKRVLRQVSGLDDNNQPSGMIVPYLSLVHDREVLEVRRGCDRGCRFCQPGYSFLPVRERSAEDIVRLSKEGLEKSGHDEYSLLSLCVSDYTSLYDTVRDLNREHSENRSSLSFPSQRADRMNIDIADELKAVRKSGITLAPEAGTERLRKVINKGLNHEQIISAIEAAYTAGWASVKLYFMCCLPSEKDEDLVGIVSILNEATERCRVVQKTDAQRYKKTIEFTCTISNFVPKPFTPFQWFGQVNRAETKRKHQVLQEALKASGLRHVTLNKTDPETALLEAVISRGDRDMAELIQLAWSKGAVFDAWDDRFKPAIWHEAASEMGTSLEEMACVDRAVGSDQPWDIIHIGLNKWWLVKEWEKAMATQETPNCTEHVCHACGICTELDTTHALAAPNPEVMKKNPFVKELAGHNDEDSHPSLFFQKPPEAPPFEATKRVRFLFTKTGELRFISHLDLQNLIIRAARRAGIRMAYTQGFNPSPKLSLASSLPIYLESEGEVGEVDLAEGVTAEEFKSRMNNQLPPEVQIKNAVVLEWRPICSLSAALRSAVYRVDLFEANGDETESGSGHLSPGVLKARVDELLLKEKIFKETPGKSAKRQHKKHGRSTESSERDIRDGIKSLTVLDELPPALLMELSCGPQLHVKPSEVLECIDIDKNFRMRLTRLQLKAENGAHLFDYDAPWLLQPGTGIEDQLAD